MHRVAQIASIAILPFFLVSCSNESTDLPPDLNGMVIVEAFHHCEKCGSLTGGIHGKGPTKHFDGTNRKNCVHEWTELDRKTFMDTATKLYNIDWSSDPVYYWNQRDDQTD